MRRSFRLPRSPLTWVLGLAAVLSVLGVFLLLRTGGADSAEAAARTVTVKRGVVQSTATGTGNLAPAKELDLSFQTSGTVIKVAVKEGQHVSQGQLIARISSASQKVALAQAEADLETAADALTAAGGTPSSTVSLDTGDAVTTVNAVASSDDVVVMQLASTGNDAVVATQTEATTTPDATTPTTPSSSPSGSGSGKSGSSSSGSSSGSSSSSSSGSGSGSTTAAPSGSGAAASGGSSSGGSTSGGSSSGTSSAGGTTSLESAQAQYDSAKLAVTEAKADLAATELRAPVAGTITALNGAVGDSAGSSSGSSSSSGTDSGTAAAAGGTSTGTDTTSSSSSSFVVLSQLSKLTMSTSFSESDIGKIKVGQAATVTVTALDGEKLAARVTKVGLTGTTSNSVVSYPVELVLTQTAKGVRSGMSASADIVVEQASGALSVPTQALSGSGSNRTLTVIDGEAKTTKTVTTGVTGDSTTQILTGVTAGAVVALPTLTAVSTDSSSSSSSGTLGGTGAATRGAGGGAGGFTGGPPSGFTGGATTR
jgi:multidrug efflux pump subunit AcrA (membrane-fusion protein)